jgi:hypothetical protein
MRIYRVATGVLLDRTHNSTAVVLDEISGDPLDI